MNVSVQDLGAPVLVAHNSPCTVTCAEQAAVFRWRGATRRSKAALRILCRQTPGAGLRCETGQFQAMMEVELVNSGPVTILLDSTKNLIE